MTTSSLASLRRTAIRLLSEYRRAKDEARTPLTRQLAETFVEARAHFSDADGRPDWRGKTYPYRVWIREIYDEAGLRGEDANRVQSAIRYHVGAALRARVSDEERAELGIIPQSPRERSHERRASRSAVLSVLNAREVAGGALLALTAVQAIVSRIDPNEVADLDEHAKAVAQATIADLEKRLRAVKKSLV